MRPSHIVKIVLVILYALRISHGIRDGSLKGGWRVTALVGLGGLVLSIVFNLIGW